MHGSHYSLVASELNGNNVGEILNAADRSAFWRLSGVPNLTFKVRMDNALADRLLDDDLLIKLYEAYPDPVTGARTVVLREEYDLMSSEEAVSAGTGGIACVCEGTFQRLGTGGDSPGRLVGKSLGGYTATGDRGLIQKQMIDIANSERDTGIRVGTIVASSSETYGPVHYKPLGEAIAELAATLDGPDFQVVPLEPLDNAGKVGEFQAAPVLGTLRDEIFFEYGRGTKANCTGYRRPVDRKGRLNRAYALAPGFPDESGNTVAMSQDVPSQSVYGLREAVVSTDIADLALRQFLTGEHIRIRTLPRQTIVFDPHIPDESRPGRVPVAFHDYDIGDLVRARAVVGDSTRFNAWFRVYGLTLNISDTGTATPQVALLPEGQG